jgi:hypothetical protein
VDSMIYSYLDAKFARIFEFSRRREFKFDPLNCYTAQYCRLQSIRETNCVHPAGRHLP